MQETVVSRRTYRPIIISKCTTGLLILLLKYYKKKKKEQINCPSKVYARRQNDRYAHTITSIRLFFFFYLVDIRTPDMEIIVLFRSKNAIMISEDDLIIITRTFTTKTRGICCI